MRLPPVLTSSDLPAPELWAARLDGDVVRLGDCFTPVDEIEQPSHRAAAVYAGLSERLIAEQLSAAWVWGALDAPPAHRQFCVGIGARVSHSPARWMTLREVVIDPDEIVDLSGRLVTSPFRTALDLVRHDPGVDGRVIRRLGIDVPRAIDAIEARRNLPNKRRAIRILRSCL